jgi:hypothetical protein
MDAAIAMNLIQKITSRDQDFCPRKSKTNSLSDVTLDPKHTEIIFITLPKGQTLRLEADIENVFMEKVEEGVHKVYRKYQLGTIRLFQNDQRNKRVEVTTVDIERYQSLTP